MTTPRTTPVSRTIVAMAIALLAGCSSDPGEIPDAGDVPDSGTFVRHEWVIDQVVASGKKEPLSDGGVTDQPLHIHFGRGSAAFSPPGESEEAFGEVHATADGKTYWTDAVAPEAELGNPEAPMEVRSRLIETHAFIKMDAGATLKMTISFAGGVTIQSDGNIVVAGSTAPNGGEDGDTGVVRYLGDGHIQLPGTRDESFGPMSNGTLEAPVDQSVDVVTLSDGTILTAVQVNAPDRHGQLRLRARTHPGDRPAATAPSPAGHHLHHRG